MTDHSDVPLVATGDWIDAAWINQYIGDNVRAWRQAYTAAGMLAYAVDGNTLTGLAAPASKSLLAHNGTSPNHALIGSDGTMPVADAAQASGLVWETRASLILFSSLVSVSGVTTSIGDQIITANTAISGVPTNATAVLLALSVAWSDVSSLPFCGISISGGYTILQAYGNVNDKRITSTGIVPLSSGTFTKRMLNTAASVISLSCFGYIK